MRPEISSFIRSIYPDLVNHKVVRNLLDVVSLRDNVFLFDHDNLEEEGQDHQKSHSNIWEVGMTQALLRHIVCQGVYSSTDIAVLTPYMGQLQKLREIFRNEYEVVLSDRDQEALAKEDLTVNKLDSEDEQASEKARSGRKRLEKNMSDILR
jgi:hypothetical protein